ncbi:luciferase family protein [Cryobacterium sp. MLB-32]|uniref:luciferase domain-containing protein n=1 Tax=Cryobacterium sp. MLB-32 TaxID=1529318 RepID=UPI001E5DBC49|nr:luciferase family protein [Cryobacterium sp. MLB-32]
MTTPARGGKRPRVSAEGPQTQLSQQSSPGLWGQLVAETFGLDSVVEGHSQVSPSSSRAVFLVDMADERLPETSLAPGKRLEPVHLHGVHDTSVHLCLPAARGAELTELGWSQPHQYEDYGTEFMIYGPRTEAELEIVLSIIVESLSFARHGSIRTH